MPEGYEQVAVVFRDGNRLPLLQCPRCAALVADAAAHDAWHERRLIVLSDARVAAS